METSKKWLNPIITWLDDRAGWLVVIGVLAVITIVTMTGK